ncbi:DNA repair protein Mus7/Mms22 [Schizosaccharomyces japonicus yFS275]|uniref:DNA repair protein Mus7/Mms22 n=1 Tax=Schizosaccharomyces japonicus (strain yFS275 / FY16936) TaxID=402676 RepID=B6K891_SCHJY|nr:DNA repair protein Mus7/Mms22 [Schizosaccharomyces japonicus yFS275]EEB09745.1 DNA repair protein Mus7/Mms22 [Schizosaccharomyces japonicus yFS275]
MNELLLTSSVSDSHISSREWTNSSLDSVKEDNRSVSVVCLSVNDAAVEGIGSTSLSKTDVIHGLHVTNSTVLQKPDQDTSGDNAFDKLVDSLRLLNESDSDSLSEDLHESIMRHINPTTNQNNKSAPSAIVPPAEKEQNLIAIDIPNAESEARSSYAQRHQFRPRRPEQQRPYTFDYLKHKMEFSRLGLQPIVVPHGSIEPQNATNKHKHVKLFSRKTHKAVTHDSHVHVPRKAQSHHRTRRIILSDEDDAAVMHNSDSSHSSDTAASSSSDQENVQSQDQFTTLKRKLRGVLPPSFLTVAAKKTVNENNDRRYERTPSNTICSTLTSKPAKGVARRKLGHHNSISIPINIDSSSSEETIETASFSVVSGSEYAETPSVDFKDDWSENDPVDDLWVKRNASTRSLPVARASPNTLPRKKRKVSRISRFPRINLVTVADNYVRESGIKAPKFLRLAARSSRFHGKRRSKQTPVGKVFLFASTIDQADVDNVLKKWKSGSHPALHLHASRQLSDASLPRFRRAKIAKPEVPQKQNIPRDIAGPALPQRSVVRDSLLQKKQTKLHDRSEVFGVLESLLTASSSTTNEHLKEGETTCNRETITFHPGQLLSKSEPKASHRRRKIIAKHHTLSLFSAFKKSESHNVERQVTLPKLWSRGTNWSTTFNIIPIQNGISLPADSFIRQGGLAAILKNDLSLHPLRSVTCFSTFFSITHPLESTIESAKSCLVMILDNLPSVTTQQIRDLYTLLGFLTAIVLYVQSESLHLQVISTIISEMTLAFDRVVTISCTINSEQTEVMYVILVFYLILCYQVDKNETHYATRFRPLARDLVAKLIENDQDSLAECYRFVRGTSEKSFMDTLLLEVWIVIRLIVTNTTNDMFSFWDIVNSILEIAETDNKDVIFHLEKKWCTIITLIPMLQFSLNGQAESPKGNENWDMVVKLCRQTLELYAKRKESGLDPKYMRTVFLRVHMLVSEWKWFHANLVLALFFDFFSRRRFINLSSENTFDLTPDFPRFIQRLDQNLPLSISPLDTCFVIFLKTVVLTINGLKMDNSNVLQIRRLISRLQPLHFRQYPRDKPFTMLDFMSLLHIHSLLISLFWASPKECQFSIKRIHDSVVFENSHVKARLISLKSWSHLMRFIMRCSDRDQLKQCIDWYDRLLETSLNEYNELLHVNPRDTHSMFEEKLFVYSKKQVEKSIIFCYYCVQDLIPNVTEYLHSTISLLTEKNTKLVLQSTNSLPVSVIDACIAFLLKFFHYQLNCSIPKIAKLIDNSAISSQDSFFQNDEMADEELYLEQEKLERISEIAFFLRDNVTPYIYQTLSDWVGTDNPEEISRDSLLQLMECMVTSASITVEAGIRSWSFYVDYGSESWERIRSTRLKRQFTVDFYTLLAATNSSFLREQHEKLLNVWFESLGSLIEPRGAQLTELLLNHDGQNELLHNLPIAKRGDKAIYTVEEHEFKQLQPTILTTVFSNMSSLYEKSLREATKQNSNFLQRTFAQYLTSLLSTMQNEYEDLLHSGQERSVFIKASQRIIGDILQYCSTFANEKVLPPLRFFLDATKFPQPPERLKYSASRLCAYARKGLNTYAGQQSLIGFIKANCDVALIDDREQDFVILVRLAMGDNSSTPSCVQWDTQVSELRNFILIEVLGSYLTDSVSVMPHYARLIIKAMAHTYSTFCSMRFISGLGSYFLKEVWSISPFIVQSIDRLVYRNRGLAGQMLMLAASIVSVTLSLPRLPFSNKILQLYANICRDFWLELAWSIKGIDRPPEVRPNATSSQSVPSNAMLVRKQCLSDWIFTSSGYRHRTRQKILLDVKENEQEESFWEGITQLSFQFLNSEPTFLDPEFAFFKQSLRTFKLNNIEAVSAFVTRSLKLFGLSWLLCDTTTLDDCIL